MIEQIRCHMAVVTVCFMAWMFSLPASAEQVRLANPLWIAVEGVSFQVGTVLEGSDLKYAILDTSGKLASLGDGERRKLAVLYEMVSTGYLRGDKLADMKSLLNASAKAAEMHYRVTALARLQDELINLGVAGTTIFFTGGTLVINKIGKMALDELGEVLVTAPQTTAQNWARIVLSSGLNRLQALIAMVEDRQRLRLGIERDRPLSESTIRTAYEQAVYIDTYTIASGDLLKRLQPQADLLSQLTRGAMTMSKSLADEAPMPPLLAKTVKTLIKAGKLVEALKEADPRIGPYVQTVGQKISFWQHSRGGYGDSLEKAPVYVNAHFIEPDLPPEKQEQKKPLLDAEPLQQPTPTQIVQGERRKFEVLSYTHDSNSYLVFIDMRAESNRVGDIWHFWEVNYYPVLKGRLGELVVRVSDDVGFRAECRKPISGKGNIVSEKIRCSFSDTGSGKYQLTAILTIGSRVIAEQKVVVLDPRVMRKPVDIESSSASYQKTPDAIPSPSNKSEFKSGAIIKDCANCPEMVVVPVGKYGRQREYSSIADEVDVTRSFAMGKYEVSRAQYAQFLRESGYRAADQCSVWEGIEWKIMPGRSWRNPGFSQQDDHPAVCISWNDAKAYANWLTKKTGKVYRLPTETEWEYAAKGSGTMMIFRLNDKIVDHTCEYANIADRSAKAQTSFSKQVVNWYDECTDGYVYTAPVGSFKSNNFGLYDMYGNVTEWLEDCWNRDLKDAPKDQGPWLHGDCAKRVVRGYSWFVRTGSRNRGRLDSEDRTSFNGFRLVRELP